MPTVRLATHADAEALSSLVLGLVGESLVDPDGEEAENFRRLMMPKEVMKYLEMPSRFYVVAQLDRQVVGMIMVRDNNYVGQFFVDRLYQGKGIGSALWKFAFKHAVSHGGSGEFKVNSSVFAEPIYRRFGFSVSSPVEVSNGFRYIPMLRREVNAV